MKNSIIIAVVALVTSVSGFLMSPPHNQGQTDRGHVVNPGKEDERDRVDSLQAEIHNDSVLYCKARAREDSLRNLPKFALNR